jgi:predicted DNA-binding transcriptional regulator AlpA
MINIMGKVYINDKEAAQRYGYSQAWFQNCRHKKIGPPFVKLQGKGKVYYPMDEADEWFKKNMQVI